MNTCYSHSDANGLRRSFAALAALVLAACGEPDEREFETVRSNFESFSITNEGLERTTNNNLALIEAWGLPSVAVNDLVLNRKASSIDASHAAISATDAAPFFVRGFQWDDEDYSTLHWIPQGLSGSGDASTSGSVDGENWLAVSWHYDDDRRSRVSFVNLATNEYRHVLLVEPVMKSNGSSFRDVAIHVGGIVWYENLLYVADTHDGMRVFDLGRIKQVTPGPGIGRAGSVFRAHEHDYVLPQVASYTNIAGFSHRWSFLGLDRSREPHLLISGEYEGGTTQLYWWPLQTGSSWLFPATGRVVPELGANSQTPELQGVHSWFGGGELRTLVTSTLGGAIPTPENPNLLARMTVDDTPIVEGRFSWPNYPEGLTYLPQSGELWTATEGATSSKYSHPYRIVFSVERESIGL